MRELFSRQYIDAGFNSGFYRIDNKKSALFQADFVFCIIEI